jgi:putative DNA primase/helicase
LRECLKKINMRYRIHIAFSASNLVKLAAKYGDGIVIADNDASKTGERAAVATGLPYWISDVEGEDFCDFLQRLGTFRASQMLKQWLHENIGNQ